MLSGEPALTIADLSVPDAVNAELSIVDRLSLDVRAGEIVCIYGLMGAGRTELLETVAGRLKKSGGEIRLRGQEVSGLSIERRIALGLALVPEDRQRDGLVQTMNVGENVSLASIGALVKGLFVARRAEREVIAGQIRDVHIKTSGGGAPIGSLSGGNQQKS